MIEADRRIPGSFDAAQGTLAYEQPASRDASAEPSAPDVLDGLAEATLSTGGEVTGLEAARMPSRTGAAAVFRY